MHGEYKIEFHMSGTEKVQLFEKSCSSPIHGLSESLSCYEEPLNIQCMVWLHLLSLVVHHCTELVYFVFICSCNVLPNIFDSLYTGVGLCNNFKSLLKGPVKI